MWFPDGTLIYTDAQHGPVFPETVLGSMETAVNKIEKKIAPCGASILFRQKQNINISGKYSVSEGGKCDSEKPTRKGVEGCWHEGGLQFELKCLVTPLIISAKILCCPNIGNHLLGFTCSTASLQTLKSV